MSDTKQSNKQVWPYSPINPPRAETPKPPTMEEVGAELEKLPKMDAIKREIGDTVDSRQMLVKTSYNPMSESRSYGYYEQYKVTVGYNEEGHTTFTDRSNYRATWQIKATEEGVKCRKWGDNEWSEWYTNSGGGGVYFVDKDGTAKPNEYKDDGVYLSYRKMGKADGTPYPYGGMLQTLRQGDGVTQQFQAVHGVIYIRRNSTADAWDDWQPATMYVHYNAPSVNTKGQIWYETDTAKLWIYDGSEWRDALGARRGGIREPHLSEY